MRVHLVFIPNIYFSQCSLIGDRCLFTCIQISDLLICLLISPCVLCLISICWSIMFGSRVASYQRNSCQCITLHARPKIWITLVLMGPARSTNIFDLIRQKLDVLQYFISAWFSCDRHMCRWNMIWWMPPQRLFHFSWRQEEPLKIRGGRFGDDNMIQRFSWNYLT